MCIRDRAWIEHETNWVYNTQNAGSSLIFHTAPYSSNGSTAPSEALRITPEGEVQLSGNSNPVLSLNRGGSNNTNLNVKYNGSTKGQVSVSSSAFELSAVGSTTPIKFYTNGNNHWQINESGVLYATGASAAKAGSIHIDYGASNNSDTDSAV